VEDAVSADNAVDHRERAYAILGSLRNTLSSIEAHFPLETHYVDDFHDALRHLSDADEDVEEFTIPDDWIRRPQPNTDPRAQVSRTSSRPKPATIQSHYLQTRVNAVLGYFTLKAAVERDAHETGETLQRLIGFETPNR
jgi:hypothetical protein